MNALPPAIWPIASIEHEPRTNLMDWRVFEVALKEDGPLTLHLVGYAWRTRDGRVTSPIQALDVQKKLAKTESGRVYELCGEPGYRKAAEFVWQEWLVATGARLVREVTDDIVAGAHRLPPL